MDAQMDVEERDVFADGSEKIENFQKIIESIRENIKKIKKVQNIFKLNLEPRKFKRIESRRNHVIS
jgi:hypothetical protein